MALCHLMAVLVSGDAAATWMFSRLDLSFCERFSEQFEVCSRFRVIVLFTAKLHRPVVKLLMRYVKSPTGVKTSSSAASDVALYKSDYYNMGSRSVTCYLKQMNMPLLNPSRQVGSIYPPRTHGRLSCPCRLVGYGLSRWVSRQSPGSA